MQVVAQLLTNKEVYFFQTGSHDFVHPFLYGADFLIEQR